MDTSDHPFVYFFAVQWSEFCFIVVWYYSLKASLWGLAWSRDYLGR